MPPLVRGELFQVKRNFITNAGAFMFSPAAYMIAQVYVNFW